NVTAGAGTPHVDRGCERMSLVASRSRTVARGCPRGGACPDSPWRSPSRVQQRVGARALCRHARSPTRESIPMANSPAPAYEHLTPPSRGETITLRDGRLNVPDQPIIPFIEGDGTGPDIWRASQRVFDAAVSTAYGDGRRIEWF